MSIGGWYPFAQVGIGYKIDEPDYVMYGAEKFPVSFGSSDTALFEVGFESGPVQFGIKHDSQWLTGRPFNNQPEYHKTELFIRYKFGGQ